MNLKKRVLEVWEATCLCQSLANGLETHTHTISQITKWANATSNFAKLDVDNTFTGNNNFNSTYLFHIKYKIKY